MQPTEAGFLAFLRAEGFNSTVLPDASPAIGEAFNYAMNVAYQGFAEMPNANPARRSLYETLVYNLAAHVIVEAAQDQAGQTFFKDLRTKYALLSGIGAVIQSASDEGTSASGMLPNWVENLSLDEFFLIKTPWGMRYFRMAQKAAPIWGIS